MILGIEASTQTSSVALYDGEEFFLEYTQACGSTQSERLLPAIDRVLQDSGMTPDRLWAIAVSAGPGSFTGIRVAVSTAKGMARAAGKPVVAVSSLAALAWRVRFSDHTLCPVLDARKGEVYAALFRGENGELMRLTEDRALAPHHLVKEIGEPCLFMGSGAFRYRSCIASGLRDAATFVSGSLNLMSAASVAEIGLELWRAGDGLDPSELVPNYVRLSEAEIRGQKKI